MDKNWLSTLTGKIVTREDVSYENSRLAWNRAIDKRPLVIVYCKCNEDIVNTIKFCMENDIEFRIRSGAHHYEGYSTGDNILVIDVSEMNKIDIDEDRNIVKIQGGVRNRELYKATGELGYPFPGGGCPTVGIVGFTLGGGWGYSSRYLGLPIQSLIQVEMINGDGDLIIASKDENPDLFWACKGSGGGNFGVVTSMSFKLPKKHEYGTYITIDYPNISIEDNINLLIRCQEEFESIDRRINFKISNYNSKDKGRGVRIVGMFYGDKKECENIIEPFIKEVSNNSVSLKEIPISEINRLIQDSHPDYEYYKSTGRFLDKTLSREDLRNIINIINSEKPKGSIYTAISFYGLGGRIKEFKREEGAFFYINSKFIIGLQSVWEDNKFREENNRWIIEKFKTIKGLTVGSFVNFPLKELQNYGEEYYGENLEKLREIKRKYDRNGTFDFEQGL